MKRSTSPSPGDAKMSKLQIVPWFSKKEWQETYQQAFSSNIELQEKAYTQMCIWKARLANLPLGVECTMSTLHVKLCDKDRGGSTGSNGTYSDRDLQLLYSTAVMRFLNQLTVLSDRKDSMYKVAEQHELPDWIISLRHEAAHGHSAPALYLLRQASDVILHWLKENYWEAEAKIMEDVVRNPGEEKENTCSRITNLLDLWVTLKVHFWAGVGTIDKIDDKNIRDLAMKFAREEGFGIKLKDSEAKDMVETGEIEEYADLKEVGESHEVVSNCGEYTHRVKTALDPLLRRIFEPLKSKSYKKILYQNCLISCLAHHSSFCPPIEVENLPEAEVLELMSLLGDLWKEVLEDLQLHGLLHCLLKQLMSQECQLASSQLWLRLVCQLIAGHPPPRPPGTAQVVNMVAQWLPVAVDTETLVKRVNLQHMNIHKFIELKPASAEETEVLQELCEKVVEAPTRFTTQYLHSLLSVREPRLSWEAREKLYALARIFTGRHPLRNLPAQVYTSASLAQGEREVLTVPPADTRPSPWTLYTGEADWSQGALGALPW